MSSSSSDDKLTADQRLSELQSMVKSLRDSNAELMAARDKEKFAYDAERKRIEIEKDVLLKQLLADKITEQQRLEQKLQYEQSQAQSARTVTMSQGMAKILKACRSKDGVHEVRVWLDQMSGPNKIVWTRLGLGGTFASQREMLVKDIERVKFGQATPIFDKLTTKELKYPEVRNRSLSLCTPARTLDLILPTQTAAELWYEGLKGFVSVKCQFEDVRPIKTKEKLKEKASTTATTTTTTAAQPTIPATAAPSSAPLATKNRFNDHDAAEEKEEQKAQPTTATATSSSTDPVTIPASSSSSSSSAPTNTAAAAASASNMFALKSASSVPASSSSNTQTVNGTTGATAADDTSDVSRAPVKIVMDPTKPSYSVQTVEQQEDTKSASVQPSSAAALLSSSTLANLINTNPPSSSSVSSSSSSLAPSSSSTSDLPTTASDSQPSSLPQVSEDAKIGDSANSMNEKSAPSDSATNGDASTL